MGSSAYIWDYERVVNWGYSIAEYLNKQPNIYLLTDFPGNIGDHLIWDGTTSFLNNNKVPFKEIKKVDIDLISYIDGCLLIPGGGALGAHFHEWLPETIETASGLFAHVIVLPSKLNMEVPGVQNLLRLSNVTFFARDLRSYSSAKKFGPISLGIDLALFSKYFDKTDSSDPSSGYGTLVCLRIDIASKVTTAGYCLNYQINNDISNTKSDLGGWIQAIKDSESIVTDRLHVAVAALMFNKNLFYFNPDVTKISDYFRFTFGSATPTSRVVEIDLEWLCEKGYIQLGEVG
jgi:exopolysaccharide biosynthesis predicted pyruvyltransferase EpsI